MKSALKGWLWFIFIVNLLSIVVVLVGAFANPVLFLSLIGGVLVVVGCALMLFKTMKAGYFIICGGAIVNFIVNLVLGANIAVAVIGLVVLPLVTYLIMRSEWEQFN